jgi:hypothetical protein
MGNKNGMAFSYNASDLHTKFETHDPNSHVDMLFLQKEAKDESRRQLFTCD